MTKIIHKWTVQESVKNSTASNTNVAEAFRAAVAAKAKSC